MVWPNQGEVTSQTASPRLNHSEGLLRWPPMMLEVQMSNLVLTCCVLMGSTWPLWKRKKKGSHNILLQGCCECDSNVLRPHWSVAINNTTSVLRRKFHWLRNPTSSSGNSSSGFISFHPQQRTKYLNMRYTCSERICKAIYMLNRLQLLFLLL